MSSLVNITGELGTGYAATSGRVEVDDTLSKSGAAADAKATGERLEALEKTETNQAVPLVFIDGEIPTTKDEVEATLTYRQGKTQWKYPIKIKCQGNTSMSYPKKNFTIKLYKDEARTEKQKIKFDLFGKKTHKYVLKADWVDSSHARNVVSARLWSDIVASREDYDSLPEELRSSPNNGAINGFPVLVYTNGTCQGLYNWNIGKDPIMWGMDDENPNHALLCGEINSNGDAERFTACNFRALWNGVDGNEWSVEIGENTEALKTSINNLITCVKDTDDETFKATIGNYVDLQSAIDYYLFQYFIFGSDNLAKNLLVGTYDLQKWYCGVYDLDATWGNRYNGKIYYSSAAKIPEDAHEPYGLLWERLEKCFYEDLQARYGELRSGALSMANVIGRFEGYMRPIGADLYAEDKLAYPGIPTLSDNDLKQLREYARDRAKYVDVQIAALPGGSEETINYALDPLEGVTWTAGDYHQDTGATNDNSGGFRSSKFTLQNCQYKLTVNGENTTNYRHIQAWNRFTGEFIGGVQQYNVKDIGVFGNPDYEYALTIGGTAIAEGDVTLMPIDNSGAAITKTVMNLSDVAEGDLTELSTNYGEYQLDVTDRLGGNQIAKDFDSMSISTPTLMIPATLKTMSAGSRRNQLIAVLVVTTLWGDGRRTTALTFAGFESAAQCAAYLKNNNVYITINERIAANE